MPPSGHQYQSSPIHMLVIWLSIPWVYSQERHIWVFKYIASQLVILSQNSTSFPLNWEFWLIFGHFGFLMTLSQKDKKGITSDGSIFYLFACYIWSKGNWIASLKWMGEILHLESGYHFRHLLMQLCLVIKFDGKL